MNNIQKLFIVKSAEGFMGTPGSGPFPGIVGGVGERPSMPNPVPKSVARGLGAGIGSSLSEGLGAAGSTILGPAGVMAEKMIPGASKVLGGLGRAGQASQNQTPAPPPPVTGAAAGGPIGGSASLAGAENWIVDKIDPETGMPPGQTSGDPNTPGAPVMDDIDPETGMPPGQTSGPPNTPGAPPQPGPGMFGGQYLPSGVTPPNAEWSPDDLQNYLPLGARRAQELSRHADKTNPGDAEYKKELLQRNQAAFDDPSGEGARADQPPAGHWSAQPPHPGSLHPDAIGPRLENQAATLDEKGFPAPPPMTPPSGNLDDLDQLQQLKFQDLYGDDWRNTQNWLNKGQGTENMQEYLDREGN